jgi:hypothetical protein
VEQNTSPAWQPLAPEPTQIDYLLVGGLATLRIRCGERAFTLSDFGSDTDGLGDLIRAALVIVTGSQTADIILDGEPQRWGLAVEPVGLSAENIRVARFTVRDGGTSLSSDGWSGLPVAKWPSEPVFECHVATDQFGQAVLDAAIRMRAEFDDAQYRDAWGHCGSLEGFPLRAMRALEAALSIPEYRE